MHSFKNVVVNSQFVVSPGIKSDGNWGYLSYMVSYDLGNRSLVNKEEAHW